MIAFILGQTGSNDKLNRPFSGTTLKPAHCRCAYQQWIAAPAWMASTEPVANGRRPMSPRTATIGVLQQCREQADTGRAFKKGVPATDVPCVTCKAHSHTQTVKHGRIPTSQLHVCTANPLLNGQWPAVSKAPDRRSSRNKHTWHVCPQVTSNCCGCPAPTPLQVKHSAVACSLCRSLTWLPKRDPQRRTAVPAAACSH